MKIKIELTDAARMLATRMDIAPGATLAEDFATALDQALHRWLSVAPAEDGGLYSESPCPLAVFTIEGEWGDA